MNNNLHKYYKSSGAMHRTVRSSAAHEPSKHFIVSQAEQIDSAQSALTFSEIYYSICYPYFLQLKHPQTVNMHLNRLSLLLFFLSFCFLTPGRAQVIGEQVITGAYNKISEPQSWNLPIRNLGRGEFYEVKTQHIRNPELKKIKKNKSQKITFGNDRQLYYFIGKLKRKDLARINYSFKVEGPIYYEDSKTVYQTIELDENGDLVSQTFYHKNGEIKMVNIIGQHDDFSRVISYDKNGSISTAFTNNTYSNVLIENHPQRGTVNQAFWSKNEIKANVLWSPGYLYIGWPHIGSLHTDKGYVLTGFHYPLDLELGNASVLFIENVKTDSCFWSLIIDGKIRELIPASIEEKPDIEELYSNTQAEVLNFQRIGTQNGKWQNKGNYNDKMKVMYEQEMVTIQTKNSESLNGYGIVLTNKDNYGAGDNVILKVGFFKNGKLHGLGYSANLQYDLGYTPKNTSLANLNGIDWKVDFGFFDQGAISRGGKIYTEKPYPTNLDVFSETFDERYKWMGRTPFSNLSNSTIPFSKVSKEFYFYLPALNRKIAAQDIDYANKTITLFTDKEGEYVTLSANDDIWAFKSDINSYRVSCPTVVAEQKYVRKQVPLFQSSSGSTTTTRTVHGVYYDKVITTRTSGPTKTFYTEKVVQDGYKNVTCTQCNGLGYLIKDKQEGAFCKINFDQ